MKLLLPHYPITVYYDGACNVCQGQVRHFQGCDQYHRLTFIDSNAPTFNPRNEGLDPIALQRSMYAKDSQGTVVHGIDTFRWMWLACGRRFLPWLLSLSVVRPFAKTGYRIISRYRYLIGGKRANVCIRCAEKEL